MVHSRRANSGNTSLTTTLIPLLPTHPYLTSSSASFHVLTNTDTMRTFFLATSLHGHSEDIISISPSGEVTQCSSIFHVVLFFRLPYRTKLRRTKLTKFQLGEQNFVRRIFCPTKILSDEIFCPTKFCPTSFMFCDLPFFHVFKNK